jgi:hypothetical protein
MQDENRSSTVKFCLESHLLWADIIPLTTSENVALHGTEKGLAAAHTEDTTMQHNRHVISIPRAPTMMHSRSTTGGCLILLAIPQGIRLYCILGVPDDVPVTA